MLCETLAWVKDCVTIVKAIIWGRGTHGELVQCVV